ARGDPDLGEEALGAEHHRQLGSEHLERYRSLVLQLRREVDRGHSSRAELTLDAIAVLDRGKEELTITGQETSGRNVPCIDRTEAVGRRVAWVASRAARISFCA